jgi:hypothetical protein
MASRWPGRSEPKPKSWRAARRIGSSFDDGGRWRAAFTVRPHGPGAGRESHGLWKSTASHLSLVPGSVPTPRPARYRHRRRERVLQLERRGREPGVALRGHPRRRMMRRRTKIASGRVHHGLPQVSAKKPFARLERHLHLNQHHLGSARPLGLWPVGHPRQSCPRMGSSSVPTSPVDRPGLRGQSLRFF